MKIYLKKNEKKKNELLLFLANHSKEESHIDKIAEKLNTTAFLVKKLVEELISDLNSFNLSEDIILVLEGKIISFYHKGKFPLFILRHNYIINSVPFKLMDLIAKEKLTSITEFSDKNYYSLASVYKDLSLLKKELQSYQIKLSSDYHLSGSEQNIRYYLYQLYFYVYNGLDSQFNQEAEKSVQAAINDINTFRENKLTRTQKMQLSFFLKVSLFRIRKKHALVSETLSTFRLEEEYVFIRNLFRVSLKKKYKLNKEIIEIELNYFFSFLVSEKIVQLKRLENYITPSEAEATEYFLEKFVEKFKFSKKDSRYKLLKQELIVIHFKIYSLKKRDFTFDNVISGSFLKEGHYDAVNFCEELFLENKQNFYRLNHKYLFNQYVFLIINLFEASFFMEPITICIDFLLGENYNKQIEKNIRSFNILHLKIEYSISEKTDILLTDHVVNPNQISYDYLIWYEPPNSSDWQNLGNKLIKLKKEKNNK